MVLGPTKSNLTHYENGYFKINDEEIPVLAVTYGQQDDDVEDSNKRKIVVRYKT